MTNVRKAIAHRSACHPRATYVIASALDRCARPFYKRRRRLGAKGARLGLPFPDIELAWRAPWSSSVRYRVLCSAFGTEGTPWPDPGLVSVPDLSELRPPTVIATMHVGPMLALGALLQRLPAETLAVTAGLPPRPGLHSAASGTGEGQRALAFAQALRALREGRFVFLALDGQADRTVDVPLFGRRAALGAGAFVLAVRADAPILPVAARWRGDGVEVVVGDPIDPAAESVMATAVGRWFERFATECPVDLGADFVRLLLRAPSWQRAGERELAEPVMPDLAV
jgi:Bacterial lipid A biosynthesis acyltransferase